MRIIVNHAQSGHPNLPNITTTEAVITLVLLAVTYPEPPAAKARAVTNLRRSDGGRQVRTVVARGKKTQLKSPKCITAARHTTLATAVIRQGNRPTGIHQLVLIHTQARPATTNIRLKGSRLQRLRVSHSTNLSQVSSMATHRAIRRENNSQDHLSVADLQREVDEHTSRTCHGPQVMELREAISWSLD